MAALSIAEGVVTVAKFLFKASQTLSDISRSKPSYKALDCEFRDLSTLLIVVYERVVSIQDEVVKHLVIGAIVSCSDVVHKAKQSIVEYKALSDNGLGEAIILARIRSKYFEFRWGCSGEADAEKYQRRIAPICLRLLTALAVCRPMDTRKSFQVSPESESAIEDVKAQLTSFAMTQDGGGIADIIKKNTSTLDELLQSYETSLKSQLTLLSTLVDDLRAHSNATNEFQSSLSMSIREVRDEICDFHGEFRRDSTALSRQMQLGHAQDSEKWEILQNWCQSFDMRLSSALNAFTVLSPRTGRQTESHLADPTSSIENNEGLVASQCNPLQIGQHGHGSLGGSIFALIIGINKYKSEDLQNLRGAVQDAHAMRTFLTKSFPWHVPNQNIKMLLDEDATCGAIISAFQSLIEPENDIRRGDAIIIYYAGMIMNGVLSLITTTESRWQPSEFLASDPVEFKFLVPHDADCATIAATDERQACNIVTNVLMKSLLQQLAEAKGSNITVILDACYSSGFTCESRCNDPEDAEDVQTTNLTMGANAFCALLSSKLKSKPKSKLVNCLHDSHVLLAACSSKQLAMEKKGRGVFTRALLKALERADYDLDTYADIIAKIGDLEGGAQTPCCFGQNRNRPLFSYTVAVTATLPSMVWGNRNPVDRVQLVNSSDSDDSDNSDE